MQSRKRKRIQHRVVSQVKQNEQTLLRVAGSLLLQLVLLYVIFLLWLCDIAFRALVIGVPRLAKDVLIWWKDRQFQKRYARLYQYGLHTPPMPKP
jgi:hypothetical protein